jgi:hypothetical protein
MQLTRALIRSEVLTRIGGSIGTTIGGDPITIDTDITDVVETICQRTDCFFYGGTSGPAAFGVEIVPNQIDYCASPLYKITSLVIRDEHGMGRPCTILTERQMDQTVGPFWRMVSAGQSTVVRGGSWYAYLKGKNSFGIWPVPDYSSVIYSYVDLLINNDGTVSSTSRPFTSSDTGDTLNITGGVGFTPSLFTILSVDLAGKATLSGTVGTPNSTAGVGVLGTGGIRVSGYGVPPLWPNDNDLCPLQNTDHMAVVWGVIVARAEYALASRDAETRQIAAGLIARYEIRFEKAVGRIEAQAGTLSQHSEAGLRMY